MKSRHDNIEFTRSMISLFFMYKQSCNTYFVLGNKGKLSGKLSFLLLAVQSFSYSLLLKSLCQAEVEVPKPIIFPDCLSLHYETTRLFCTLRPRSHYDKIGDNDKIDVIFSGYVRYIRCRAIVVQ